MILGYTPLGSMPLGGIAKHPPIIQSVSFLVSRLGWAINGGLIDFPSGTAINKDQPQYQFVDGLGPPIDAIPLNQYTYDLMVNNNGVIGLGYPYWAVTPG